MKHDLYHSVRKKFLLVILLSTHSFLLHAQKNIDSLETIVRTHKDDSMKVMTLGELCWGLEDIGELDKAKKYADQALRLSQKLKYKNGLATAWNELGIISLYQGDFPRALLYYDSSMTIRKEMKDKKNMATLYSNIGYVYMNQGRIPEALKNDLTALKMREEIGDKMGMAQCYNNIGIIYMYQNNFPEALKNYYAAIGIEKKIGYEEGVVGAYLNIGIICAEQGRLEYAAGHKTASAAKYEQAFVNYTNALTVLQRTGNKKGIADAYHDIAVLNYEEGNMAMAEGDKDGAEKKYALSLHDQTTSIEMKKELGDKQGLADSYSAMGDLYLKRKDAAKAKSYYAQALALSLETGSKNESMASYNGLSESNLALGDAKGAYENYKLFIVYRDSLNNEENTKKTVQSQMQYEFDKKQTADSIKNAEQVKQESLKHEEEIRQQQVYTYGGAIGFVLMLIVAGVSFRAYRQKQKANTIISEQKALVEEKQKEVLDSIQYAKRIQHSLLPTERYIARNFERLMKS